MTRMSKWQECPNPNDKDVIMTRMSKWQTNLELTKLSLNDNKVQMTSVSKLQEFQNSKIVVGARKSITMMTKYESCVNDKKSKLPKAEWVTKVSINA